MRQDLVTQLAQRREELGMTYEAWSSRSGVSVPTLKRLISGRADNVTYGHVKAAAHVLGVGLDAKPIEPAQKIIRRQIQHKAKVLVGRVQATSALEKQGLRQQKLEAMTKKVIRELSDGPRRRIWAK